MTPAETVPRLIARTGRARHAGRRRHQRRSGRGADGAETTRAGASASCAPPSPHLLRIVGPNCIGYAVPRLGLNASFGPGNLKAGRIAAVAQSGAVLAGLADWGTRAGHRLLAPDLHGRHGRRRFRRRARHAGARPRDARHPDVRRRHHAGAQVHVGGARRRPHEAGDRAQGRPPCRGGQGRGLAHRRRWRARPPSTTRPSRAPAWCGCTAWASCSMPPRRWATASRRATSGWPS